MYGYIYKTTNLLNNKVYIGQRKGGFRPTYFGSGIMVGRALSKYGRNNFAVIALGYAHSRRTLDSLEKYYIKVYRD